MEIPLTWSDDRLSLNGDAVDLNNLEAWYYVDPSLKEALWFPDVIISNLQRFETIGSFKKTETFMVSKQNHGQIHLYYVAHHLITFTCPMRFDFFPFDTHSCDFEVCII